MDFSKIRNALEKKGYRVFCFDTKEEAVRDLSNRIQGSSIGFGGSVTVRELGLFEALGENNKVYWHWNAGSDHADSTSGAAHAEIYMCSVNAVAETGEIVNIDGTGNRVASTIFGHKKVIFVVGKNKITSDAHSAVERARTVAAPLNARRLAAAKPEYAESLTAENICSVLSLFYKKPGGSEYEVVLINEDLGY